MIPQNVARMTRIGALVLFTLIITQACRKSSYLLEESDIYLSDDGTGTGTVTWTANHTYYLDGLVFVNDGQTLTIEPGTVIKAKPGQGGQASALIVSRGGRIMAEGTRDKPIIFTAEADDLNGSVPIEKRGLWGGLIILGNAPVHTESGEASIEGIPFYEPRGVYGGLLENDNSGVLRYVSIRHGGTNLGEGNEINGLTLAGVGRKTEIDYVEIISNEDDGIELFGGTVNLKHVLVAFCGDDAFDYDLGYAGKGQFLAGIQYPGIGDRLFETGGTQTSILTPAEPIFHNITLFGGGPEHRKPIMSFLDNASGKFYNSLFVHQGYGIELHKINLTNHSYEQWQEGHIAVEYCWFDQIGNNSNEEVFYLTGGYTEQEQAQWAAYFEGGNNRRQTSGVGMVGERFQVLPVSADWDSSFFEADEFFESVEFKGAFGSVNWAREWTLFDQLGLFVQ